MQSEFWELIEQARAEGRSCAGSAHALETILSKMPASEIEAFASAQDALMSASYRWDLWGAAFVINGGCSDDGFDYFRGWLMLQGRDVWEAALRNPESLADISFEGDAQCEDFLYAASTAYEKVARRGLPSAGKPRASQPDGTPWVERDLEALYPKLWGRFGTRPSTEGEFADVWDARMQAGMVLLASGAFDDAARAFAQLRRDAPRQLTRTIATNNLAWTNLMMNTPAAVKRAVALAEEALHALDAEPRKLTYNGNIKGTLAFALIKSGDNAAGLALIDEVLANETAGPRVLALRLCVHAIGLARAGDVAAARSVVRRARRTDPGCQLLTQAIESVGAEKVPVPVELQDLTPLLGKFGISDDLDRSRAVGAATTEELEKLVSAVTQDVLAQIDQFLDQTLDAENAVPFGDLAQAAIEARLELKHRGSKP